MARVLFVALLLLALAFAPGSRSAPMTPEQIAKLSNLRNKIATGAQYVPEDLKYIRCGTCISIAQQIKGVMGEMASRAAENGTKVDEGELLDVLEHICDTDTHGLWIRWLDLQEHGEELRLVNVQKGPGACGSECRTVAKACQDLIDSIDVLELGEKVWSNPPAEQLAKSLCREMSDVCVQPDPPIPKDRKPGPEWQEDALPEWSEKQKEDEQRAKGPKGKKKQKKQKQKAEL